MSAAATSALRAWTLVLGVSALASLALALAGLPSPVLFGALLGGMVHALTAARPRQMPRTAFLAGQGLIGATIGALVSPATLVRLGADAPSILGVTAGTLLISVLAGRLLALRRDVSPTTGVFALIAGGASGIVALARDLGADDRVVTIVQYLRVLLVLLAMPLVATLVFQPGVDAAGAGADPPMAPLWPSLGFTVVAAAAGVLVGRFLRVPAGAVLCALVVAAALSASGILGTVRVPAALENLGYALIGVQVGLRFTRESLRGIAKMLPVVVALIVLLIVASAGMGVLLSEVTGVDRLTAYLATTPGGLFAVLAIAASSGADATYVLAVQVIRIFAMLLAAPLLARVLRRGEDQPGGR